MRTTDYLDELKRHAALSSDYQLAKVLGLATSNITMYRKERRVMDDYVAAKIAQLLERDPLELIAVANAERARTDDEREYWSALAAERAPQKKTARRSGPSNLAPRPGLEPGTYGLTVRRSTD